MKLVQLLRSKGHAVLTREEEDLCGRFDLLLKQLRKPAMRGRLDEIRSQIDYIKTSQQAINQSSRTNSTSTFGLMDDQTAESVFKV
jgi:hypothetical protein